MKYTNRNNVPEVVVKAIENDPYDGGKHDTSVTRLIKPQQANKIMGEHFGDIVEDISDSLFKLFGQSVHSVLERGTEKTDISEVRFTAKILERSVSGKIDHFSTSDGVLSDFKITSVFTVKRAKKEGSADWETQLNLLAYLMGVHGFEIKKLQIIAFSRDWRNSENNRQEDYPNPIEVIEVPLWNTKDAEERINRLVEKQFQDEIVPCTDDERWYTGDTYAVYKDGANGKPLKKAARLLSSMSEAEAWSTLHGGSKIEMRPGESSRCGSYCSSSPWCEQYAKEKSDG